jgi:hypothetical protein
VWPWKTPSPSAGTQTTTNPACGEGEEGGNPAAYVPRSGGTTLRFARMYSRREGHLAASKSSTGTGTGPSSAGEPGQLPSASIQVAPVSVRGEDTDSVLDSGCAALSVVPKSATMSACPRSCATWRPHHSTARSAPEAAMKPTPP